MRFQSASGICNLRYGIRRAGIDAAFLQTEMPRKIALYSAITGGRTGGRRAVGGSGGNFQKRNRPPRSLFPPRSAGQFADEFRVKTRESKMARPLCRVRVLLAIRNLPTEHPVSCMFLWYFNYQKEGE